MSTVMLPTALTPNSQQPDPDVPTLPIYRLSVDQYHAMIQGGILSDDDPVELLAGWLVQKMPKNRPHTLATRKLRVLLEALLASGCHVDTQEPVTLATSEPQPDVLVIRGAPEDYADQPRPRDLLLLVEVADTTLERDRSHKQLIYAQDRVPIYWIVNLTDRQVEVYSDPTGATPTPQYRQKQIFGPGDAVPVVIDGQEVGRILVRDMLP